MSKTIAFFIGPGFGHYLPVANLAVKFSGCRLVFLAPVSETHPLAQRILSDGFEFIPIIHGSMLSIYKKAFYKILKLCTNWLIRMLAIIPSKDDLPHWSARLIFGIHSYLKPSETTSRMRTSCIEQCIEKILPDFAFVDDVVGDPFPYICSKFQLPWIGYATGPVNVVHGFDHPVYPSGFSPCPVGLEYGLNRLLLSLRRMQSNFQQRALRQDFPGCYEGISSNFLPQYRIAFSIAEIDNYLNAPQTTYRYLGCSLYQPQFEDLPQELNALIKDKDEKIIYASFGSTGTPHDELLYRTVLEAFSNEKNIYLILQISQEKVRESINHEISRLGLKNVNILGPLSGPPYRVYRMADLVISHGGYNTVMESLYYGVPVLLIPNIAADRMEVARRVIENNCGACVNYYRVTSDEIRGRTFFLMFERDQIQINVKLVSDRLHKKSVDFEQLIVEVEALLMDRELKISLEAGDNEVFG